MKRVLITRPQPGATETANRLTALGFFPVLAPVLVVVGRPPMSPANVAAIVLTSGNAIAACAKRLHKYPVFAVGAATAARAIAAGFVHVYSADGDAEGLVELITRSVSPVDGPLFLPTGQGQGIELVASLRQRGFRVLRRVAYQTSSVAGLTDAAATSMRNGEIDAALFFSAESSRQFVRLLRAANLVDAVQVIEAVSISERAAVALRPLLWRRISVAAKPNQDAMLAMLHD